MWLTTIHAAKVKPEFRDKVILYRREVAKILADYFFGKKTEALQPSTQMAGFIREVVGSAVKSAIQEVSSGMIAQTVKATVAELRGNDPLYIASQNHPAHNPYKYDLEQPDLFHNYLPIFDAGHSHARDMPALLGEKL
jgi:hypothetical protein